MAKKIDVSAYRTFGQISDRLDDIVAAVRDADTSLERSLDLFDEAIALGSAAVDMVDATDFSPEEQARLAEDDGGPAAHEPGASAPAGGAPDGEGQQ